MMDVAISSIQYTVSFLRNLTVGWFRTKPEFVTVLADKVIERGKDLTLSCEANTNAVTATWEKKGKRLACVHGKHTTRQTGNLFILEIRNAQEEDEGKYTLTLSNITGSATCSATVSVELKEWRKMPRRADEMIQNLKQFQICDAEVPELRFLLHGPIGSGKSSIINTIKTIFENRPYISCLAARGFGKSQTLKYQKYAVERFAFYDVMGLEEKKENESKGVHMEDLIYALRGHIDVGYKFDPEIPISDDDKYYIRNPSLHKIHCLVSVVPADNTSESWVNNDVINRMKTIRTRASALGIPEVVVLTKVDKACPTTNADLSKIYKSQKIKEKMEECSVHLNVPMNCIFPVKNYHEETQLNEEMNCLMLDALTHLVTYANDSINPTRSA